RHVERPDAAADGGGERALDADDELLEGRHRILGQPVLEAVEGLLAGEDLHPGDPLATAVGLLDRGVEHRLARTPDVGAGPVALDERDDRAIGNLEPAVRAADRVAWGNGHDGERGHADGQTGKPRAVQARVRRVRTRSRAASAPRGGGRRLAPLRNERTEWLAGVDAPVVAAGEHL